MPTLLQINSSANASSHGKIAESIGALAIKEGWRSVIAYGRRVSPSQSELIHIGTNFELKEHGIESRLFDNHGLASRFATRKFVRKIQEIKPDIIQLHNIHGYYLNYKLLFEYLNHTNIPIVWTLHDCWSFTGHCSHFIGVHCDKWKTFCHDCSLKRAYPKSYIDRSKRNFELKRKIFTANSNLHIVTVSEWLGELAKQSFFYKKDIRVIGNGVDINVFRPVNFQQGDLFRKLQGKSVVLGVASVWGEHKGLTDFVRLNQLLKNDEQLVLIGINEDTKKQLPSNIICIPRTNSSEELAQWYNRADIVLSLSKAETFGLTVVEGMACGTPAIVYDNTAQPELITKDTGFVIKEGDIRHLYETIQIIKKNGREFYSNACRTRAEKYYNRNVCYEEYVRLYKQLLQIK